MGFGRGQNKVLLRDGNKQEKKTKKRGWCKEKGERNSGDGNVHDGAPETKRWLGGGA